MRNMGKSMTKAACIATLTLVISGYCTAADQAGTKDAAFFEERVAPVLCGHCTSCHNEQIQASDLSFYTRKEVLDGGERGPAVVPYKPEQSILIHAINRDGGLMKFPVMMPPGPKLPDEDIETLTEWVRGGAPWGKESLACALGAPPPI
jgi:Planctomycete cytochrome C